jgi:DNA polymerase I
MFHASDEESEAGGHSTAAIKATLNWLRSSLLKNSEAAHIVVWDGRAQWRYDLYPTYKSNRTDTELKRKERAEFNWQLPWLKQILSHMPLLQIEQQMVCARLFWQGLRKGAKRKGLDDFKALPPLQAICEVKALAGDTADTLEGVPLIADARATTLIQQFGSLERLLAAARDPFAFQEQPKWAKALALPQVQELVLRNREMVTLSRGPSLSAADCLVSGNSFDEIELLGLFEQLEFWQWFDGFESNFRRYERPMPNAERQAIARCLAEWAPAWEHPSRDKRTV